MKRFVLPVTALCLLAGAGAALADDLPPGNALPPPPPPAQKYEFEIVGDYAGKDLVITVNDREIFRGNRPLEPAGVRWHLRHDIRTYPASLSISIEGCAGLQALSVPETEEGPLLIFRGCDVEILT